MLDPSYIFLIVVTLIIGGFASFYVRSQLKKYKKVPASNGLTGAQMAQYMLQHYEIHGVGIKRGGADQDFFDPRTNSVTLSPEVYDGRSVMAAAVACHEVGHAYQFAQDYTPMKIRGALVPAVNLASNSWMILLMIGILLSNAQLYTLAIVLYAAVVIFQLVTLPVEFDASRRAMSYMNTMALPQAEQAGAFSVLRACALTYVAAALTSILQLVWLLGQRQE